jgi:hypothetical protein
MVPAAVFGTGPGLKVERRPLSFRPSIAARHCEAGARNEWRPWLSPSKLKPSLSSPSLQPSPLPVILSGGAWSLRIKLELELGSLAQSRKGTDSPQSP